VYGMKPTYGAVSRYGVIAMASSTDTIGCFARSTHDVAVVMSVMAGQDPRDMTTIPDVAMDISNNSDHSLKIGIIEETMTDNIQPEVRESVHALKKQLETQGHSVTMVSLPMMHYTLAMYYIIVPAEISSNLARYDGVRFGTRAQAAATLAELYGKSRGQGFVTENKRRIMIGSYVLSSGYFDAYYQQAQKARTLLIRDYNELFASYDILITPTAPTTAFAIGENSGDPVKMYLADIMTVPPSLAGLPALNIPYGVDNQGLPIGIQLVGQRRTDAMLLQLAASLEEQ